MIFSYPYVLVFVLGAQKNRLIKTIFLSTITYVEKHDGSVGRVIDSGSKDPDFETRWRHCVVSVSKTPCFLLSTGSTQEDRKSSQHD